MRRTAKPNKISNWVRTRFETFSWRVWIFYCFILFLVGTAINYATQFSFRFFVLHQLLLITATTLLVSAMKSFFADMYLLNSVSSRGLLVKNPEVSATFKHKLLPLQNSCWPFLTAIVITGFFFTCIVLLEYIKLDLVGIYAIYIAGTSVLIGVYGYMQYLFFLWFINKAGKCGVLNYNKYAPADSDWITQIAKTSQRLRNYFLFIGLIYVIEYSILIPTQKIAITKTSITLAMPNNVAFVVSWIALFFLVIVAFPVINHIQHLLISKLVSRLKNQTINELSDLMFIEESNSSIKKERLTSVVIYSVLIENVRQTKAYPIKRQLSYETAMTLVTFIVHSFNLYTKVASIPPLNLF